MTQSRFKNTLAFLLIAMIATQSYASPRTGSHKTLQHTQRYKALSAALKKILKTAHQPAHIGIVIEESRHNKIIFQKNAQQLFTPASVLKLFTATAGLIYLGPDFQFKTRIRYQGSIKKGTLHGNLAVQFSGDPTLTKKQLATLIARLKTKGIKKITGHVTIDSYHFDQVGYAPGWMWDELSYGYAAPVNAIMLNENRVPLTIHSSKTHTSLSTPLPHGVANFNNHTDTKKTCPPRSGLRIYSQANNHYELYGCVPKGSGPQYRILALRDPTPLAKKIMTEALKKTHILYHGPIAVADKPFLGRVLLSHSSAPLLEITQTLLENSDNLMTDAILKTLGAQFYHTQGTWQNGLQAMEHIIQQNTGIDLKDDLIVDGAGLSRYNLIAPQTFMRLFTFIDQHKKIKQWLYHTMAIAGKSGTVRWRLRGLLAKKIIVHAKTGSMTGVNCLAGFIHGPAHKNYRFIIMVNGFTAPAAWYHTLEDTLVKKIALY